MLCGTCHNRKQSMSHTTAKDKHNVVKFWPRYHPYNTEAEALTAELIQKLGLADKHGKKRRIIVSSFLQAVQRGVEVDSYNGDETVITWLRGHKNKRTDAYQNYPGVSDRAIATVREALVRCGYISQVTQPGRFIRHEKDSLPLPPATRYYINFHAFDLERLSKAAFVDASRKAVLVTVQETYEEREQRRDVYNNPSRKLSDSDMHQLAGFGDANAVMAKLNRTWQKHPLRLEGPNKFHSGRYASVGTSIFDGNSLKRSGRIYGAWTNKAGASRLGMTIDNEPLCAVDINANSMTLLAGLFATRMKTPQTWSDAYEAAMIRLSHLSGSRRDLRTQVKDVVTVLTGTGNPHKAAPAKDTKAFKVSEDLTEADVKARFVEIRDAVLEAFPAILNLDKDYVHAHGAIFHHESNILKLTLLKLTKLGVVAYSIHDGYLVKQADVETVVTTVKQTFSSYIRKHQQQQRFNLLPITPALTVEALDVNGNEKKLRIKGSYEVCDTEHVSHDYVSTWLKNITSVNG